MTLAITDLFAPATAAQWQATLLANATKLQLQTTSWQAGGVARTILAIMANLMAQEDGLVSAMAQGGFLDFAATGTVAVTSIDGTVVTTPVTPDPSIPAQNPDGAPGWLDLLADSVYDVQRTAATQASGLLAIANTSASSYGPYAAGSFHAANPATAATYANAGSLTIAPGTFVGGAITAASSTVGVAIQITTSSAHGLTTGNAVYIKDVQGNIAANGFSVVTVTSATQFALTTTGTGLAYTGGGTTLLCQTATFKADLLGPSGTSGTGQISQAITSNAGVVVSNTGAFFGAPYESNVALAARCRAKIQSLSPGGPSGAYSYFALSAFAILSAQTPPVQLSAPITRVLVQPSKLTGQVNVIVASDAGDVPGVVQLPITGASTATPIVLTTASAHGLSAGAFVTVSGVLGNTNANGTFTAAAAAGSSITLAGSVGNGTYLGGGSLEGGDLGEVDAVIQANAVPDSVTAYTQTAAGFSVAVIASVVVPQAQVAAYSAAVQVALALYFRSVPIGGTQGGFLQYNDVIGVLYAAGSVNGQPSYVASIPSLTLNGASANVAFPGGTSVAKLSPAPVIGVTGA